MKIYLTVGKAVRSAEARIVGKVAVVQTDYGPREFGKWYSSELAAKQAIGRKIATARRS